MAPTARVTVTDDGQIRVSVGRIGTVMEPTEAYHLATWMEFGVCLCCPEVFLPDPVNGPLITSSDIAQEVFNQAVPVRQGPPNVPEPRNVELNAYRDQDDHYSSELHLAVVSKTKKTAAIRLNVDEALDLIARLNEACAHVTFPGVDPAPATEEGTANE